MEIRHIRCVITVYETKNVTKAASRMYLSQQSISGIINQVEKELGVSLFHRFARGMLPPSEGEAFYKIYKPLLDDIDRAALEFVNICGVEKMRLRIALAPGVLRSTRILFLSDFSASHPEITIERMEMSDKKCWDSLLDRDAESHADVAFCPKPLNYTDQYEFLELSCEPLFSLLSLSHPLARRTSVTLRDLCDYEFASFDDNHYICQATIHACQAEGLTPNITVKSLEPGYLRAVAESSDLVFIAPEHIAEDSGQLRPVFINNEKMIWPVGLAFTKPVKPQVEKLLAFATENL